MTFAVLRALHALIGDALDDIERVYADGGNAEQNSRTSTPGTPGPTTRFTGTKPSNTIQGYAYASPPPSPLECQGSSFPQDRSTTPTSIPNNILDFPSLDNPFDPNSPSESLTSNPVVTSAVNRIIAATGQMSATVQIPFLSLCDAGMGFHLPSCLRLLEATHTVEILREAGPNGLHVKLIAEKNGVEKNKLAHVLRLLATHHILREISPNVFANNRLSSVLDTGKLFEELKQSPETKYRDTNGISAFFGMCTDELYKSAGFLTEAYFLSPQRHKNGREPTRAPFNHAFGCEGVGFFGWLEGEGIDGKHVNGPNRDEGLIPGVVTPVTLAHKRGSSSIGKKADMYKGTGNDRSINKTSDPLANPNRFRLERFGKAMTGTESWEVPGAVLNGFDWQSLPKGSVVVDVGGGIGSTSMLLAHAYSRSDSPPDEDVPGLKFVIQDREVVVEMGEKAWNAKCPELIESGIAQFQVHDFFTSQPIKNAAVFLLRVVLHDWPDAFAERILLRLREAAAPDTKLLIADFVLPLACADDFGSLQDENEIQGVQGMDTKLAPPPLLPNLGKASANGYWMDMTMQVMFNGQERTLREIVSLAHSAGWKVTKVTKAPGSLFGHIIAEPCEIPLQRRARAGSGSAFFDIPDSKANYMGGSSVDPRDEALDVREMGRASSRCGTPTFGSRMDLPSYEEARARFGGAGALRGALRRPGVNATTMRPSSKPLIPLLVGPAKKKKPSPLSVIPQSPSPVPRNIISSPRPPLSVHGNTPNQIPQSPVRRRTSYAQLNQIYPSSQQPSSPSPTPAPKQPLMSPRVPTSSLSLNRRASLANLSSHHHSSLSSLKEPPPPLPTTFDPIRSTPASQSSMYLPLSHSSPIITRSQLNLSSLSSTSSTIPSPASMKSSRSPVPTSPSLSRRQSYATLSPSAIPRKRSESNADSALPPTLGGRGNMLMRTLELSGGLSPLSGNGTMGDATYAGDRFLGSLDFGNNLRLSLEREECGNGADLSGDSGSDGLATRPVGSVLAAAARIESLKSTPRRKMSMTALNRQNS